MIPNGYAIFVGLEPVCKQFFQHEGRIMNSVIFAIGANNSIMMPQVNADIGLAITAVISHLNNHLSSLM